MKLSITGLVMLLGLGLAACGADKASSGDGSAGTAGSPTSSAGSGSGGRADGGSGTSAGSNVDGGAPPTTPPGTLPAPMPLISSNVPAFASSTDAGSNTAGAQDWQPTTAWLSGAMPAWLAYDLSKVPSDRRERVLVAWYDGAALDFINPMLDAGKHWPVDYTLETNSAGGGGAPPSDGWTTIETVTANDRNARQRLIDLGGANWVRMSVTKSSNPGNVGFDLDVHSAPDGATDSWLFMGDSITFMSTSYLFSNLPSLVHALAPDRWPAIIPAAIGGTNTTTALAALDSTMQNFPGRFVVLAYGTNDHPNEYHMEELVQKVIAAGKVPVVPHVPWSSAANIQAEGPQINGIIDDLYAKYPEILHGPDFWAIFTDKLDLIPEGDVHPNDKGKDEFRKQWAKAMTQ
jgi:GDSL-like Lipase/Acylhydrolase family